MDTEIKVNEPFVISGSQPEVLRKNKQTNKQTNKQKNINTVSNHGV